MDDAHTFTDENCPVCVDSYCHRSSAAIERRKAAAALDDEEID